MGVQSIISHPLRQLVKQRKEIQMNLKEIEMDTRRNFNNAICLMGIIPALTFAYLLTVKVATIEVLKGETGYVFLAGIIILLIGIFMGKKLLWNVMKRLFDFNKENLRLQEELMEKNRLATIIETTLTLGHELNNPLAITVGNLDLLENDLKKNQIPEKIVNRFNEIRQNCDRMREAMRKLSKLSTAVSEKAYGDETMVSLKKSK